MATVAKSEMTTVAKTKVFTVVNENENPLPVMVRRELASVMVEGFRLLTVGVAALDGVKVQSALLSASQLGKVYAVEPDKVVHCCVLSSTYEDDSNCISLVFHLTLLVNMHIRIHISINVCISKG